MAEAPTNRIVPIPPLDPYVPAATTDMREYTVRAIVLGILMGILFMAANAYAGLKTGLTVSASIPSAVISMAVLRGFFRGGTILENNVVHTIASTGESLAAGVIFTIPAFFFLGLDPNNTLVFLLGAVGGLLGILLMIPLRRALVVEEHATLPYPEGAACAKVLIAGDKGGVTAVPVFIGLGVGAVHHFLRKSLLLWREAPLWTITPAHRATIGIEATPLLMGIGYLIGPRIAAVMLSGSFLAWCILIPVFDWFGQNMPGVVLFPATVPIAELSPGQIWSRYIRYIGAGGVAAGGLISLLKAMPTMVGSIGKSVRAMRERTGAERGTKFRWRLPPWKWIAGWAGVSAVSVLVLRAAEGALSAGPAFAALPARSIQRILVSELAAAGVVLALVVGVTLLTIWWARTEPEEGARDDRDLPIGFVFSSILGLAALLLLLPQFNLKLVPAGLALFFALFFVTVSARLVGLIGSTSQPVSGMTIAALLVTSLILAALERVGYFGPAGDPASLALAKGSAIMVGAVVCIAICLSGDMSQDLKTGVLVGATPSRLQLGEMVGTLWSAVRVGLILLVLAIASRNFQDLPAPQGRLMATVVNGVFGGDLPWVLIFIGAGLALTVEMLGVGALSFAIGLYLPISTFTPIMLGGLLAWLVSRSSGDESVRRARHERGGLVASGLVAGDALMGIVVAIVAVSWRADALFLRAAHDGELASEAIWDHFLPFVPLAIVAGLIIREAWRAQKPVAA